MEIARHVLGLEHQRSPDLRKQSVKGPALGKHADHGVRFAIQTNGSSDQLRVGAELRFPGGVAQYYDVPFAGLILVRPESAPQHGLNSEDIEVMRRGLPFSQLHRFACLGERRRATRLRGHILEDGILILPIQVVQR